MFGEYVPMCFMCFFCVHAGNLSPPAPCTLHTENKNQHLLLL